MKQRGGEMASLGGWEDCFVLVSCDPLNHLKINKSASFRIQGQMLTLKLGSGWGWKGWRNRLTLEILWVLFQSTTTKTIQSNEASEFRGVN